PHVRQRRGDALRVTKLLAVAEAHRRARIDDEIDREVFLFFVEAKEEAIEALIDVPIEVTEVVTGLVFAMIGELDAGAALFRAPLGSHPTGKDTLRDER